jgi:hypothetical protein
MLDRSLNFGIQNFVFCKAYVGSEISGDTAEYAAYMTHKGLILIAKYPDDNTALYVTKVGNFDTVMASRGSYTYVFPNRVQDLEVGS